MHSTTKMQVGIGGATAVSPEHEGLKVFRAAAHMHRGDQAQSLHAGVAQSRIGDHAVQIRWVLERCILQHHPECTNGGARIDGAMVARILCPCVNLCRRRGGKVTVGTPSQA